MSEEQNARPRYVAHTPNDSGSWQSMEEHVEEVTRLSETFAGAFGAAEWGQWAGILHEIGKYSDEFQQKLEHAWAAKQAKKPEPVERVDHKSAGAGWAWKEGKNPLLSMLIYGHHGGIPSVAELKDKLAKAEEITGLETALQRAKEEMEALRTPPALAPPEWARTSPLAADLFCRMVYSCLVDADSLDTEAHFNSDRAIHRGDETPLPLYHDILLENQTRLIQESRTTESEVNRVRREVYEACLSAASEPPGVYRLTVPTGGGKTRSSLAFALEHAIRHGMERVIYAIPYTSIIDQTVQVFRDIFGEEPDSPRVVEHHSAVPEPRKKTGDLAKSGSKPLEEQTEGRELRHRLACENWDARLIVTTTVQLFESLFSHCPGRCRKVHRLAKSVIILDEVQTLPLSRLNPILDALNLLATRFGATVVLCTATQPAFEGNSPYLNGFERVREILPTEMRNRHFQQLKRVEYRIEQEPWPWERVAEEMAGSPQCLTVLNTRKDALALLDALEGHGTDGLLHLSTLLCGAHRKDVIAKVKHLLKTGEPVRLVATQVVEAGVDLDFPKVLRAVGPLDRIIQAAGRCNREGRLDMGDMTVFYPEEGRSPKGHYAAAMGEAEILLRQPDIDFHDPDLIEGYYRSLYGLVDTDERKINEDRKALDFPKVQEKFRIITEDTVPVLTPYDREKYNDILEEVARWGRMTRDLWRGAQPYLVSIPRCELNEKKAMIDEVVPDQLYVWKGQYDELRRLVGIAWDPGDLIMDGKRSGFY